MSQTVLSVQHTHWTSNIHTTKMFEVLSYFILIFVGQKCFWCGFALSHVTSSNSNNKRLLTWQQYVTISLYVLSTYLHERPVKLLCHNSNGMTILGRQIWWNRGWNYWRYFSTGFVCRWIPLAKLTFLEKLFYIYRNFLKPYSILIYLILNQNPQPFYLINALMLTKQTVICHIFHEHSFTVTWLWCLLSFLMSTRVFLQ